MFRNSLENLGKSTGESKNNYSGKFPKFLKIFANLRRSPEIFETHLKSSEKKLEYFAKCSRRPSSILKLFMKSSEIIGSLRKSPYVFGKLRKGSEICRKVFKITFLHFGPFLGHPLLYERKIPLDKRQYN